MARPARLRSVFVLSGALVVGGGCASRVPEIQAAWIQGGADRVWLPPPGDVFCYLTRIAGNFSGGGEMVHLGLALNNDRKVSWVLEGHSDSDGVTATAACSPWKNYVLPHHVIATPSWEQSDSLSKTSTVPLTKGSAFCYLGGLRGRFGGAGESVAISAGSPAELTVSARDELEPVSGSAVCVNYEWPSVPDSRVSQTFTWSQDEPGPTPMIPSNQGVCFITELSGDFRGLGEWVEIRRPDPRSSAPQLLAGHSERDHVTVQARCLSYASVMSRW